jgi:DNA-binding NtrC family response regulator
MADKPTVLIASDNLSIYQLMVDILEITFKAVKVERVLDSEKLLGRLADINEGPHLIILDAHLGKENERTALDIVRDEYPGLMDRMVLLCDSLNEPVDPVLPDAVACLNKPFSLDEFGEIAKRVCGGQSN